MWKPTAELRLVKRVIQDRIDHTFMNEKPVQVLQQKWIKEGFKDEQTYVIETEWRDIPEA
jgi:hypothetical protein